MGLETVFSDHNYDDHSQAYFPHMDKENGIHVSLNLNVNECWSDKKHFYLCSLIQTFIFIPFLIQGYIGSDWDSYALIGTVNNYVQDSVYLPSRPPGFPLYEVFLSFLFKISIIFNLQFEKFLNLHFLILYLIIS